MDFKKLFMNNKAVSPVIGVILMVAITVILAAAIGSSVFGQGTAQSAPQANLDIQTGKLPAGTDPATVKIEHLGGDTINFAKTVTKVVASVNDGTSETIDVSDITDPLDVGDVQTMKLKTSASAPLQDKSTVTAGEAIASGDIVNIKIIDIQTSQLICDKDVRF